MSESLSICLGQYSDDEPQDMSESLSICAGQNSASKYGAPLLPSPKSGREHKIGCWCTFSSLFQSQDVTQSCTAHGIL
jgi:hypothetical protein